MTDLVKRLRLFCPDKWDAHPDSMAHHCALAADRIEELEHELAKAQSDLLAQQHDDAKRIEQLEEALYWYVSHVTDCEGVDYLRDGWINADEKTKRIGEFVKTFRAKQIPDPHNNSLMADGSNQSRSDRE